MCCISDILWAWILRNKCQMEEDEVNETKALSTSLVGAL